MLRKIAINSKSTGKFRTEVINSRPHLVTEMVSIEGDSIMNGLLYPLSDITNSFAQLDALHAPASHPVVNGENITAFHPLAVNAFNVGGIVLNPRMVGKQVINDIAFDIEVAEKDERGKAIMERIKNGEAIGVSTGLNATVTNKKGNIGNTEFSGIVSDIKFDHVAVLLDEPPAGDNTFTINNDVTICNLAESVDELQRKVDEAVQAKFGTTDRHVWARDILFSPERAIVVMDDKLLMVPFGYDGSGDIVFTGEGVEVERKVTYEIVGNSANLNNEGEDDMDKRLEFVLALVGNSSNRYTMADKDKLLALSETDLVGDIHNNLVAADVTVDAAQVVIEAAGMTVNAADHDAAGYADFVANAEGFKAYREDKAKAKQAVIATILSNSKMSQEQVDAMSDDAIESLANSLVPTGNYSLKPGATSNNDRQIANADDSDVDLSIPVH